jgi:hypothetical protein
MSMKLGTRTWGVGGGVPRRGAEETRVVAARAPSGRRPGRMGAKESGVLAIQTPFPLRKVEYWQPAGPLHCQRSRFLSSTAPRRAKNAWRERCAGCEGHRALGDPGARARQVRRRTGVLRRTGASTGRRRRVLRDPGTGRALASRRVWALRRPRPCARSAANISTARRARTAAIRDREGHPRGPGEGALAFGSSGRWCRAVSEALSPVYTRVGFSDGSLP